MDRREFVVRCAALVAASAAPPQALAEAGPRPLSEVRAAFMAARRLSASEKRAVIDAAINVVQQVYVHREMKQAEFGIDVVPQLRALRAQAASIEDADFRREMRRIFVRLRDRHTRYLDGDVKVAKLGITIEQAFEGGLPKFFITEIIESSLPSVLMGSEVRRWQGAPLQAAIDALAQDVGAGNEQSRKAVARRYLTQRPTSRFDLPAEDRVSLDIVQPNGKARKISLAWHLADPHASAPAMDQEDLGLDPDYNLVVTPPHKRLRVRGVSGREKPIASADTIEFDGKTFGHLRIESFAPRGTDTIDQAAENVRGLLTGLPTSGLIIDIRGNGGGKIALGEKILQFLRAECIPRHGYRMRASPATQAITSRNSHLFMKWQATVRQGLQFGSEHSADFTIGKDPPSDERPCRVERVYSGPTVLLVDAITYSTSDMFASTYQYLGMGEIICTDANIGAGGANVITYDLLKAYLPAFVLEQRFQDDIEQLKVTPELVKAFADQHCRISTSNVIKRWRKTDDARYWRLEGGDRSYLLCSWPKVRTGILVDYQGANRWFPLLPKGVGFSFAFRQSIRKESADGLILEDAGIKPDHLYNLTKEDVLDGDTDLFAFACRRLMQA